MTNSNHRHLITINKLDDQKKKTFSNRTIIAVIVLIFYAVVVTLSYLVALPESSWVNVLYRVENNPIDFNWSPLFDFPHIAGGLAIVLAVIIYLPLLMCLIDLNNLIFKKENNKSNYKSLAVIIALGTIQYLFPSLIYIFFQYFSNFVISSIDKNTLFQKTFYVFTLSILFSSILSIIVVNILLAVYKNNNFKNTITLNFLIFIVPIGFLSFQYISIIDGWAVILFLLFAIAGTDVFAYVTGLLFGKRKMAPIISPNKTWEGAFGGVFLTMVLVVIYSVCLSISEKTGNNLYLYIGFYTVSDAILWITILLLTIALAIFSILGDLLFSYIKRAFSIKDFGTTLKSHGGFLDRFDSLVICSFVFFAYTFAALAISLFALPGTWTGSSTTLFF